MELCVLDRFCTRLCAEIVVEEEHDDECHRERPRILHTGTQRTRWWGNLSMGRPSPSSQTSWGHVTAPSNHQGSAALLYRAAFTTHCLSSTVISSRLVCSLLSAQPLFSTSVPSWNSTLTNSRQPCRGNRKTLNTVMLKPTLSRW